MTLWVAWLRLKDESPLFWRFQFRYCDLGSRFSFRFLFLFPFTRSGFVLLYFLILIIQIRVALRLVFFLLFLCIWLQRWSSSFAYLRRSFTFALFLLQGDTFSSCLSLCWLFRQLFLDLTLGCISFLFHLERLFCLTYRCLILWACDFEFFGVSCGDLLE